VTTGTPVSNWLELKRLASGQWLAFGELGGHYGEGPTAEEAVADLIGTLRESRDLLRERHEQLSQALASQLAALEGFFGPE